MEQEDITAAKELREKAEESLAKKQSRFNNELSEADIFKLVYELEVHQIELEMQNEELILARAEAVLVKDKYLELYDFAPSGYITLSKDGKILELNINAFKILGKDRSQLKNKHFALYVSKDYKIIFSRFLERVFESQSKEACEVFLENDDIPAIFVLIEGIYLGKNDSCELSLVDITQQKQIEEAIRIKNEELIKINASKDKFFGIIAHDLRSPFNGFLGLSKLMSEDMPNLKMCELQTYASKMHQSAKNLFKLLENLLEWSQLQRGLTKLHPDKYNLRKIIDDNFKFEFDLANQKEIELISNISADTEVTVDLQMINTIIRNLISNSIKFTNRGGRIEIGTVNKASEECIYIKDNGIGMDTESLENIFKLDGNVSRPGTENESSTGLGLLLCKEFIEKQGGKIWAESEPGKGSTFYFTLPE